MKSPRIFLLVSIGLVLAALGYMTYQMFWGPESLEFAGKSFPELLENGGLLAVIAVPVVLLVSLLSMRSFLKILFPGQIKGGVRAPARVLKVWDTGVSINNNPQVGLLLEVTPAAGSSFQAEGKTVVSRLQAALVRPGIAAEVLYDPNRPQKLQILTLDLGDPLPGDPASRLEQLEQLRQRGLITAEEYAQKREQILKDL